MLTDVESVLSFVSWAHAGQVDKAGVPYVLHVARVGGALASLTDDFVMAGLLHDVVEDTPFSLDYLASQGLPDRVVQAVDSVTKRPGEPTVDAIRRALADPIGRYVKAADVLDNASRLWMVTDEAVAARLEAKYELSLSLLRKGGVPVPDRWVAPSWE